MDNALVMALANAIQIILMLIAQHVLIFIIFSDAQEIGLNSKKSITISSDSAGYTYLKLSGKIKDFIKFRFFS